jgi:hypothetical protein
VASPVGVLAQRAVQAQVPEQQRVLIRPRVQAQMPEQQRVLSQVLIRHQVRVLVSV